MSDGIRVRAGIVEEMLQHARNEPRAECCGLLAGLGGLITKILPAQNALASPTSYEIAPAELFQLFRSMREEGLDHLGLYHSHHESENFPSPRDRELAYYPSAAYFIISPRPGALRPVRAFSLRDGRADELEIIVVSS